MCYLWRTQFRCEIVPQKSRAKKKKKQKKTKGNLHHLSYTNLMRKIRKGKDGNRGKRGREKGTKVRRKLQMLLEETNGHGWPLKSGRKDRQL